MRTNQDKVGYLTVYVFLKLPDPNPDSELGKKITTKPDPYPKKNNSNPNTGDSSAHPGYVQAAGSNVPDSSAAAPSQSGAPRNFEPFISTILLDI